MDAAVKILLSEIKYEVKFESWRREKITNDESRNVKGGDFKAVDYAYKDDRAEDWLVRQIQDAMDNVVGELRWCVDEKSRMQSDEIKDNPTEWEIVFHFSENWVGSMRKLKSNIHRYVCDYVLARWYRASGDVKMQQNYESYSQDSMEKAYEEARSEIVRLEPWRL